MQHYVIDCREISSREELHRLLAETLSFPEWYGHNLDALFDCLMEIGQDTELVLKNWKGNQRWMEGFVSVFTQVELENPFFMIKFR